MVDGFSSISKCSWVVIGDVTFVAFCRLALCSMLLEGENRFNRQNGANAGHCNFSLPPLFGVVF